MSFLNSANSLICHAFFCGALLFQMGCSTAKPQKRVVSEEGTPFGPMSEQAWTALAVFVESQGISNFSADIQLANSSDSSALKRILRVSRLFTVLDGNARTYGNVLYSLFLRTSEANGCDWFGQIVAGEPAKDRQRVRDFLFYPARMAPRDVQKETRTDCAVLFPDDFKFAREDDLFKKE
jgi:hypothetical protein